MNQSALTKFFRTLEKRTACLTISFPNKKFRVVLKDTLISKVFGDMLHQSTPGFFEQHMKYFITQQAAVDEADLLVNNPDIQVDDLQQDGFADERRKYL